MSIEFSFELEKFMRQINSTPEIVGTGARSGMQDALNDWQADSRDNPFKDGELRRQIQQKLEGNGLNIEGKMTGNVYNRGFNYGYWQHNVRGGGGLKYIDNSAKEHQQKWMRWIEDDIKAALKKSGW